MMNTADLHTLHPGAEVPDDFFPTLSSSNADIVVVSPRAAPTPGAELPNDAAASSTEAPSAVVSCLQGAATDSRPSPAGDASASQVARCNDGGSLMHHALATSRIDPDALPFDDHSSTMITALWLWCRKCWTEYVVKNTLLSSGSASDGKGAASLLSAAVMSLLSSTVNTSAITIPFSSVTTSLIAPYLVTLDGLKDHVETTISAELILLLCVILLVSVTLVLRLRFRKYAVILDDYRRQMEAHKKTNTEY